MPVVEQAVARGHKAAAAQSIERFLDQFRQKTSPKQDFLRRFPDTPFR